jgi:hypothetical protein
MNRLDRHLFVTFIALSLALGVVSCSPGTVNTSDEARLSLAGPARLEMFPGESVDLSWLLVRQGSGPEAGHSLQFIIVGAGDHGCTISQMAATTDANGLGGTTFTAGPRALVNPIQV